MAVKRFLLGCLWTVILISCTVAYGQNDTTTVKFSTEEGGDRAWNKRLRLKKNLARIMDDTKQVLSVGVSSGMAQVFDDRAYRAYKVLPADLSLSYERKVLSPSFSVKVDLLTRFLGYEKSEPDYIVHIYTQGRRDRYYQGKKKLWVNVGLRYYYNKKKRYLSERSGNNVFGQYLMLQLQSPLAYQDEQFERFALSGLLSSQLIEKSERTFVGSGPTFMALSWGIQQRILKRIMVDSSVGIELSIDEKWNGDYRHYPTIGMRLSYIIIQ